MSAGAAMGELIEYAVAGGIATLTFNRPQVMNALDPAMLRAFPLVCARARDDANARVLVLRGAGRAFAAGGDVGAFKEGLPHIQTLVAPLAQALHQGITTLREMPKPVIASVHGAVAGAGMSIMLAADLIVAADNTQFTTAYARIGASPDGGATWFLPKVAGYHKAMALLLLADAVDAQALHACGVIHQLAPPAQLLEVTQQLAQRLAQGPANVYAEIKRLLNTQQKQSLAEHLGDEAQTFARCAVHANFAEGVTAFTEKRAPKFDNK